MVDRDERRVHGENFGVACTGDGLGTRGKKVTKQGTNRPVSGPIEYAQGHSDMGRTKGSQYRSKNMPGRG
jgi:hypothetical protein